MTLTADTMEWLNMNRRRSYPMRREEWRMKVPPESGLDCVLLDALAFDPDSSGSEEFTLESVEVREDGATVTMKYGGSTFAVPLSGGDSSGEGSYVCVRGTVQKGGLRPVSISLSFSSHAYMLDAIGEGAWTLGCPVMESRAVRLSDGVGVDSVSVNGSQGVEGHESKASLSGDVVLEDGFRTSPVVHRGEVVVRVGNRYGLDPCKYEFGEDALPDCRKPLFFFCGQNAVNGGNVVLQGGEGISITQGRKFLVDNPDSKCYGMRIPCIEIIAGKQLLDLYAP